VLQEKPGESSKKQPEQAELEAFPELKWDFQITREERLPSTGSRLKTVA
jgi:hypothetical protein